MPNNSIATIHHSHSSRNYKIVRFLFICICITTILNGSYFWLQLVGWVNPQIHQQITQKKEYFLDHSKKALKDPQTYKMESVIHSFQVEVLEYKKELFSLLYTTTPQLAAIKIIKYLITIILIFYSGFIYLSNFTRKNLQPLLLSFILLALTSTLLSLPKHNWQTLLSGGYVFSFIFLAITASSIASAQHLKYFSICLCATITLLIFMAPFEIYYGLNIFNTQALIGKRIVGFMIQPNSLGIYVVCIFALSACMLQDKIGWASFFLLITVASGLIILSGSNTAAIVFITFLLLHAFYNLPKNPNLLNLNKKYILLGFIIFLAVIMIILEGRPALKSALGRITHFQYYFSHDLSITQLLFGNGLGIGSNTLYQINNYIPLEAGQYLLPPFITDSTILLLLAQVGLFGCCLFYGILIKAIICDQKLRLVYLVFILCSLTINIIEVFPLNIVLGLMLANSFNQEGSISMHQENIFANKT